MLAQGVPDHERTRTFARYSLIGALSMATGSFGAALPDFMTSAGIERVSAFKIMFYVYAALGLLCATLYWLLPHARMDESGFLTLTQVSTDWMHRDGAPYINA